MTVIRIIFLDQLLRVIDTAYRGNAVNTKVGANEKRLGIAVTDTADTAATVEIDQILLKLGTERCVADEWI